MTENDILKALKIAYQRAGTQASLAKMAGISQGRVADYLNGRYSIGNMTVSTLLKIFPDMLVDFFGNKTETGDANRCRDMLLNVFDALSPDDQMRCLAMVIANFPDKIREETKK